MSPTPDISRPLGRTACSLGRTTPRLVGCAITLLLAGACAAPVVSPVASTTGHDAPVAPTTGPDAPVPVTEDLPPQPSRYTYTPDSSWHAVSSGSGDTLAWTQTATTCTLELLSMADVGLMNMADPRSATDENRSRTLLRELSKNDTSASTGETTLSIPREGERPVQFASRQTVEGRDVHGYATRAFAASGGFLYFELTCPGRGAVPGDFLGRTLAAGHLAHPR